MDYHHYQDNLLKNIDSSPLFPPLRHETKSAFLACPRHLFIHRYRTYNEKEWTLFDPSSEKHLEDIYRDEPIVISGEGDFYSSSNSQPSFILGLLEKLDLQPGENVLEVGSGSGWLSGMMARIVGPQGRITGIEIIKDLAIQSQRDLDQVGITNVNIVHGNGNQGFEHNMPYDKVIFTAGLYSLPPIFYDQVKIGGILVAPFRVSGMGDVIEVLKRTEFGFQAQEAYDGYFVPLVGQNIKQTEDTIDIANNTVWRKIKENIIYKKRFWWANATTHQDFIQKTFALRSFMTIAYPKICKPIYTDNGVEKSRENFAFGFFDEKSESACIATNNYLTGYGNATCTEMFVGALNQWVVQGMPTSASFSLTITRDLNKEFSDNTEKKIWCNKRGDSFFYWSLDQI